MESETQKYFYKEGAIDVFLIFKDLKNIQTDWIEGQTPLNDKILMAMDVKMFKILSGTSLGVSITICWFVMLIMHHTQSTTSFCNPGLLLKEYGSIFRRIFWTQNVPISNYFF